MTDTILEQGRKVWGMLHDICLRLGEGHLQDGFGDDSRADWVQRMTMVLDDTNDTLRPGVEPQSPWIDLRTEKAMLFDWLLTKFKPAGLKMDGTHHWVLNVSQLPAASTALEAIKAAAEAVND